MTNSPKFWIGLVIGLLGMNISVGAALVYFAHSDPSHAVEKDYYEKALAWDDHRKQLARNEALGWSVKIEAPRFEMPVRQRDIRLEIRDSEGNRIENAAIEAVAFHNARAGAEHNVDFTAVPEGGYIGSLRLTRPGWWQFDVVARRGRDLFTSEQRLFIDAVRR